MIATVRRARKLDGAIRVPGDKSISHRALILGSIASGRSRLGGLSPGADVQSTLHRARNDALTSQLRSAIRKATLALKAGKHAEAATALADATPVIDSMVNKGIIHRNKAARHKSRLTKQVRALAK